jgi:hypothetical protein
VRPIIGADRSTPKENSRHGHPSREGVADRFDHGHRRTGARADVPEQDHPDHRALSGRWQHRSDRARHRKNLQDSVGQPVIVENKPGANAAIGIDALMRSDPDGHTLAILSDSPVTINVHLLRLNYDPLTDLVPISKVVSSPII